MKPDYRSSKLWHQALASRPNDLFETQRALLRSSYETFWDRSVELARGISHNLPGLTLHDDAHFSALWDRASQLLGDKHDINPLEAFVFGGAVLLHDTGHAFAAFPKGRADIEKTNEYRDAIVTPLVAKGQGRRPTQTEVDDPPDQVSQAAIFTALRRLHARQAGLLIERQFEGRFLLMDDELRGSLGELIGKIAASHQEDRSTLKDKLGESQGAPGFMPQSWSIRPVYLACLLRCADAIQIDQTRAPPFSLALHQPSGLSRLHWLAQQLAQHEVISQVEGLGTLRFTSQKDFQEVDADAWWVAYDLIQIANKELQSNYELMLDLKLPRFSVDRVQDAENPQRLKLQVKPSGWEPINAEVRITNVDHVIRILGGSALYGTKPSVPLRELIQNSADAVRARRQFSGDSDFRGKIILSLTQNKSDAAWTLCVEDNGIGMSQTKMLGTLLEFGKSLWGSSDLAEEFPGLASANLNQTGRYGIGFFSVLTIASFVRVTSRRFDAGYNEARTITFRNQLRLRPLLSRGDGSALGQLSTRVELAISADNYRKLLSVWIPLGHDVPIDLRTVVAQLCCSVDCDVFVRYDGQPEAIAHKSSWELADALPWLRDCVFADAQSEPSLDVYLQKAEGLLSVLKGDDGALYGRAAIAFGTLQAGIASIGGLVSGQHSGSIQSFDPHYIGVLAREPHGPSRFINGSLVSPESIALWASEQATLAASLNFEDLNKYLMCFNIALFGGDPMPVATVLINRNHVPLQELFNYLNAGEKVFAVLDRQRSGGTKRQLRTHRALGLIRNRFHRTYC